RRHYEIAQKPVGHRDGIRAADGHYEVGVFPRACLRDVDELVIKGHTGKGEGGGAPDDPPLANLVAAQVVESTCDALLDPLSVLGQVRVLVKASIRETSETKH